MSGDAVGIVAKLKEKPDVPPRSQGSLSLNWAPPVRDTALNEEVTEHLGRERHGQPVGGGRDVCNGTRPERVLGEATGPVEIEVPRDWAGTSDPQIVRKRQRLNPGGWMRWRLRCRPRDRPPGNSF